MICGRFRPGRLRAMKKETDSRTDSQWCQECPHMARRQMAIADRDAQPFPLRRDRAMSADDGRGRRSPGPRRTFDVNTNSKHAAGALVNESGRMIASPPSPPPAHEPVTPAKQAAVAAKPKAAPPSKSRKAARRPRQSSRATSKADKLVCRYCGSDDLAPSFRKRRDARCRACFKKRYRSAARGKSAKRTRKVRAAK